MIIDSSIGKSGVPFVALSILKLMTKQGYSFDLIYNTVLSQDVFNDFKTYTNKQFKYSKNKKRSRFDRYFSFFSKYFFIKKILKKNEYDAIHSFCENLSFPFLICARRFGIKTFIVDNNSDLSNKSNFVDKILKKIEIKYISKYAIFKATSETILFKSYGKNVNYKIIQNTINKDKFPFKDVSKKDQFRMIQVGTINENKNQIFTLEVFNIIKQRIPSAFLYFYGYPTDVNYFNKLKKMLADFKLENSVLIQSTTKLCEELAKSSCFLLTSKSEVSPIVLIEAQSVGLKCYCSPAVSEGSNIGNCFFFDNFIAENWANKLIFDFEHNKMERKVCDLSKNLIDNQFDDYKTLYDMSK